MSRRHAAKALLTTAAVSALTVGGFGVVNQPAQAASASPTCSILEIILGCTSSSSAPSSPSSPTSPTTSTSAPTAATSAPTSATSAPSSPTSTSSQSSPSGAKSSSATTAAKPKPSVNVTLSNLRTQQRGRTLVVRFTVTNTGTLSVGGYLITAHIPGYRTRAWVSNLPVGQPIQVSATWQVHGRHSLVKVVVKGDPRHQVKESDESDNVLFGSRRLR